MKNVNATININTTRQHRPCEPLFPHVGNSYTVRIVGIPADVNGVIIRYHTPTELDADAHKDIAVDISPNGCFAYADNTTFTAVGQNDYEVLALDAEGNPTFLGRGLYTVCAASSITPPNANV